MNNLHVVQQWLLQKHIQVSREWLEACVEWIVGQLPNSCVSDLKDVVYSQWITEDLHKMGCHSLPHNITSNDKIILTGKYILQINSLRDISQPAHGQLMKNRNCSGQENLTVSAAPQEQEPPWKIQPKRTLYLEITDGSQGLYAMEYKPISQLNIDMSPGTKVLVSGPVECRMGVLLLMSKNIQVLGGHVESLIEINSQEQVLNRALGDKGKILRGNSSSVSSNLSSRLRDVELTTAAVNKRNTCRPTLPVRTSGDPSNLSHNRSQAQNNINNERMQTGQKRSYSNLQEDDDAFFENMDVDMLVRASQDVEAQMFPVPQPTSDHHQAEPDGYTAQDDFDYITAEQLFEDEMCNLETSADHLTQISHSSNRNRNTDFSELDWNSPYRYLSSVTMESLPQDEAKAEKIIVKGFITTVTSQLKPHSTCGWQLRAKVNDGSMSVEVDLSNRLLTELIGLTVKDAARMKTQAKINPKLNEQISKSVNRCQTSLRTMNGLMELALVSPRPTLLKCAPLETKHIRMLADRVVAADNNPLYCQN